MSESMSSMSTSPEVSGVESWDMSTDASSQEILCRELIRRNVDKLGHLADQCERINSNMSKVVNESHHILDNSFLASQTHLTDHVTDLNYTACVNIGRAMTAYSEYMVAVEELVEAEDFICRNLATRLHRMNEKATTVFELLPDNQSLYADQYSDDEESPITTSPSICWSCGSHIIIA